MASSSSLTSTLTPLASKSPFCPRPISRFASQPLLSSSRALWSLSAKPRAVLRAATMDFSGSFFERRYDDDDDDDGEDDDDDDDDEYYDSDDEPLLPILDYDGREEPECPPGLREYETMMVLRPDMSEDERLNLTQRYEELLVAGGGMYVEVYNRGVIPLAYEIRTKDKDGDSNIYLDGIYLLFTFFTKPASIAILNDTMNKDDDVIRSGTSKRIRRKKWARMMAKSQRRIERLEEVANMSGSD